MIQNLTDDVTKAWVEETYSTVSFVESPYLCNSENETNINNNFKILKR